MSRLSVTIEDILHSAGYRTARIGGEVNVYDPVYRTVGHEVITDSWQLKEIRSAGEAFAFIDGRS